MVRYVTFFTSFFAACLYHLVDQFSTLNATWEKSASGGMNVSPTVPMCHAWVDRQLKSTLETQDAFWRSVIAIHRSVMTVCVGSTKTKYDPIDPATSLGVDSLNIPYTRASRILQHAACEVKRCIDANQSQDLLIPDTVAFVFDEARSFLQPVEDATDEKQTFLHYMRLAMYFFPREKIDGVKVVVALLDTFGSVAEYTPPTIPDPSLRFISDRRMYPPFVAFPHQARPLRDWNPPLNRDDIIKIWRHAGRHLWASYALPQHLLQVAEMKLSGGTAAISHNGINRMLHLAVIGTRVEFHFNSQSKLLLPLVHHHGATLYSVSTDRTIINVGYPSEPLLAAAATALTLKKSVKWTFLLGTLIEEVRTGLVPAGERGELTARALFLMALDFVRSHSSEEVQVMLTQTFTVRNLLNALFYGTERPHLDDLLGRQWGEKNKQRFLDQGIVNYTHFVYVTHSPRQSEIWRYFYNFAAIFCRRGQDVFDLVIPVYLKDAADYSYIVVQVKLHLQGTGLPSLPADVEVKGGLREEDSDAHRHPYLYVFLQLGQRSKPWKSELHMDKSGLLIAGSPMLRKVSMRGKHGGGQQMATIGACGLSTHTFPFLTADECTRLVQLSTAWVDPVDNVRDPPMSSSDSVAYDEHLDLNTSVLESLLHLSYPDTGGGGSNGDDAALDDTTVDDADEISNGRNSGGASTSANSTIKRKRYQ